MAERNVHTQLPPRSVLLTDSASYHNVYCALALTSCSWKQKMMDWLQRKDIHFATEMLKADLYQLIKLHKWSFKRYKVDELISSSWLSVLRMPPYYLKNVLAQLKDYVSQKNVSPWLFKDVIKRKNHNYGKRRVTKNLWCVN